MDYLKQPDESDLDYIVRLVDGKSSGICDIDYTELFKLAFNVELSSTEARKRFYGLKMILPYIDEAQPTMFLFPKSDEELKELEIEKDKALKQIEIQKQQLIKEKMKVQTEKIGLNQALREQARFELFIEQAIKAIEETKPIEVNTTINPIETSLTNRSGILMVADHHYGKELKIKGLYGETLNEYNIEIFETRMWKLLNETINIVKKEGFNRISVFNLGDELEGMLRISQLMTLKLGLVDSAIAFAYFFATWLNELSKYVSIDYYSTEGNHTDLRLLTGKKGDFPHENMSKVIQTLIREILKDNTNIKVYENDTDKIFTKIQGFNVLGIHGEEKNVMRAIRDFSFIYNTPIDFLVTGHKHHANSINAGIRKGCIGVGSVIGIDDFSMELKRVSDPTATFVVLEEGKGKTLEYTIQLN